MDLTRNHFSFILLSVQELHGEMPKVTFRFLQCTLDPRTLINLIPQFIIGGLQFDGSFLNFLLQRFAQLLKFQSPLAQRPLGLLALGDIASIDVDVTFSWEWDNPYDVESFVQPDILLYFSSFSHCPANQREEFLLQNLADLAHPSAK